MVMYHAIEAKRLSIPWMAVVILLPGLLSAGEADTEARRAELVKLVAPELKYVRKFVSEDDNALPVWTKAAQLFIEPSDPGLSANISEIVSGRTVFPAEKRPQIDEWLKANQNALHLLSEGLQRRCFQVSVKDLMRNRGPFLDKIRALAGAKIVRMKSFAQLKKWDDAARELADLWRIGYMVGHGDGGALHYLIAHAIGLMNIRAAHWLASQDAVPEEVLRSIISGVGSSDLANTEWAAALRVEFNTLFVEKLSSLADNPTASEWEAYWREVMGSDESPANLVFVLSIHPTPLNKQATVQLAMPFYIRLVREADALWPDRDQALRDEVLKWKELEMQSFQETFAAVEKHLKKKELFTGLGRWSSISNPGGRLMVGLLFPLNMEAFRFVLNRRTEADGLRLFAALRLFEIRHRHLPERLQELQNTGLLSELPLDPFSGRSFQYSSERGVLWGVGSDGQDDGGIGDSTAPLDTGDCVWRLHPMK